MTARLPSASPDRPANSAGRIGQRGKDRRAPAEGTTPLPRTADAAGTATRDSTAIPHGTATLDGTAIPHSTTTLDGTPAPRQRTGDGPAHPAAPPDPDPADCTVRRADPLAEDDRRRLLAGAHHDPHTVLGAHPASDGVDFRVLRPHARAVTVVISGRHARLHDEGDGLFAGRLPLHSIPDYRLLVSYSRREDRKDRKDLGASEDRKHRDASEDPKHRETREPRATVEPQKTREPQETWRTGEPHQTLEARETQETRETRTEPQHQSQDLKTLQTDDPYRHQPTLGELDLHLISEGRHERLWDALGATVMDHQGVAGTRFAVWAPNALGVRVTGDFAYWDGTGYPMRSLGSSGVWELFLPGIGEGTLYKYEITCRDGTRTVRADPMARSTECPPATASVVHRSRYQWRDAAWLAARAGSRPLHESPISVYEVHLPSWRQGLNYRQLAEQLPAYVKELGFTHVELMPMAEHPFGGSWGYQVTSYYAPTARLGSPDDFKFLVDELHRAGIGVLMDWVPAHFPKDDWALARFDGEPLYEHPDPARAEHPDWGTLEFDYGRTEVRNFLVANAVFWCEEFHIDGLRVDAVASMLYLDYSRGSGEWTPNVHGGPENLDAVAFLQEMNATVYRRCPGVMTAAEESTAWDGVTRATHQVGSSGFGGLGFGFKWNMGWMHDSLGYISRDPVHRKYHHNEMTFSMVYAYSENYILPISHDEVVHGKGSLVSKMPGDWWQRRANHRAYLGFMWAHPGKQLLFMGQEFAQGGEWDEANGPDWWLVDPAYTAAHDHLGVRDLVRDLNLVYAGTPALWQRDTDPSGFAWIDGGAAEDNVFAFLRFAADGSPLLAVSNFSPVVRHGYRLGVPGHISAWREVLNTDQLRYGGSGILNSGPLKAGEPPWHGRDAGIAPVLPPLATVWLRPAEDRPRRSVPDRSRPPAQGGGLPE